MKPIASFVLAILFVSPLPAYAQKLTNDRVLLSSVAVENAYPRLSADGKSILFQSNRSGRWQLYILDVATGKDRRITNDNYNNNFPDWSPDNKKLAFVSDRNGKEDIYLMDLSGSTPTRITEQGSRNIHPYFSPDGRYLLFNSTRANKSLDIFRYELATAKTEQLTNTPNDDETCARYNGAMTEIVFLRNNEGEDDIHVMHMSTGLTDNVSKTPAIRDGWPVFSKDGQWIYYSSMDNGRFGIYRIKPDGSKRKQLSFPEEGEEDARVSISDDNRMIVYNKRKDQTIDIRSAVLN